MQLKETYSYNQKSRYETLLKQLVKFDEAILQSDTSTASVKDLMSIKNNILLQLEQIEKKMSADAKVTKTDEMGYKEHLRLKLNEL
jgi:hypothetical protein